MAGKYFNIQQSQLIYGFDWTVRLKLSTGRQMTPEKIKEQDQISLGDVSKKM